MVNFQPDHCPDCGSPVEAVDPPTVSRCETCEDYVFHNPCPGGGTVVVDGDSVLLIEDFRTPGGWKLPEGRVECGESPREGVARELEEETGLAVDTDEMVFLYDSAGEPVPEQYMVGIYYAARRSATTGTVEAGSDATDARFWTPEELAASDQRLREKHRDPFWYPDLERLRDLAVEALDQRSGGSLGRDRIPGV